MFKLQTWWGQSAFELPSKVHVPVSLWATGCRKPGFYVSLVQPPKRAWKTGAPKDSQSILWHYRHTNSLGIFVQARNCTMQISWQLEYAHCCTSTSGHGNPGGLWVTAPISKQANWLEFVPSKVLGSNTIKCQVLVYVGFCQSLWILDFSQEFWREYVSLVSHARHP